MYDVTHNNASGLELTSVHEIHKFITVILDSITVLFEKW